MEEKEDIDEKENVRYLQRKFDFTLQSINHRNCTTNFEISNLESCLKKLEEGGAI